MPTQILKCKHEYLIYFEKSCVGHLSRFLPSTGSNKLPGFPQFIETTWLTTGCTKSLAKFTSPHSAFCIGLDSKTRSLVNKIQHAKQNLYSRHTSKSFKRSMQ